MSLHLAPPLPPPGTPCTHSCTYMCTHTWSHVHRMNTCMHVHMYEHICTQLLECTPTHMYACTMHAYPCTHTCGYTAHMCTYAGVHVHTHTHTWQSKRIFSGFRSLQKTREVRSVMAQPLSEESWRPGVLAAGLFVQAHRCQGRAQGGQALDPGKEEAPTLLLLRKRTKFMRISPRCRDPHHP